MTEIKQLGLVKDTIKKIICSEKDCTTDGQWKVIIHKIHKVPYMLTGRKSNVSKNGQSLCKTRQMAKEQNKWPQIDAPPHR